MYHKITTIEFSLFSLLIALSSERAAEVHGVKTKNSYSVIVKTIYLLISSFVKQKQLHFSYSIFVPVT